MYDLSIEKVESQNIDSYENEHYLQTDFWADFKSLHGWKKMLFKVSSNGTNSENEFFVSVLVRRFAKFFSLCYIPMGLWQNFLSTKGMIFAEDENFDSEKYFSLLEDFSKKIKPFLPKNTICIRFDPPIELNDPDSRDEFVQVTFGTKSKNESQKWQYQTKVFKKSSVDIQPPDTTILDLTKTEEELLSNMKNKWRYNIRLAEKKGVQIVKGTSSDIDTFYNLYLETSKRDGIAIHSKKYYKDLLELSEQRLNGENARETPLVTLYIAKHEDDVLAAIITLFTPYQATYVYGASCNIKRNLMPAYLLQWTAIQDAKKYGSKTYDFYGMPPRDDENHPMYGLYRFKTGFSGQNKHRIGSVDFPTSPFYGAYRTAEKMRSFWFKKVKKAVAGR